MEQGFTELIDIREIDKLFATKLWVARDENGWLHLWFREPHRARNFWIAEQIQDGWLQREEFVQNKHRLDDNLFPEIEWEDEPLEIKLFSDDMIENINENAYQRGYKAGIEDFGIH